MRGAVVLLRKDRVREALQYYCGKIEYVVRRDIRYKLYIYRGRAGPKRAHPNKAGLFLESELRSNWTLTLFVKEVK
jgi:hypothetical protein